MATVTNRTKVIEQMDLKPTTTAKNIIEKLGGAQLGSPINSKAVGEQFDVVLTGKIEIREFNGVKSAHYLLEKGFSIRVNASFDPKIHKANAILKAEVREMAVERNGVPSTQKYLSFID